MITKMKKKHIVGRGQINKPKPKPKKKTVKPKKKPVAKKKKSLVISHQPIEYYHSFEQTLQDLHDLKPIYLDMKWNEELNRLKHHYMHSAQTLFKIQDPYPIIITHANTNPLTFPIYTISINAQRANEFIKNIKPHYDHVSIFPGTVGKQPHALDHILPVILPKNKLTLGELGCFDSHQKLWKHISEQDHDISMICEDDANLCMNEAQQQYIREILHEIQNQDWDIIYLSWYRPYRNDYAFTTPHIKKQWTFSQLWCYFIKKEACIKLAKQVHTFSWPVDVYLYHLATNNILKSFMTVPSVCLTVGCKSDTAV